MARTVQLLRQEVANSGERDACDRSSVMVLLLCCCEAVSALCVGVDGRALGGHDSGLDYGYALGNDCLDDDDDAAATQLGGDYLGGQGQGQRQGGCRSLFKAAGLCPLLAAALEMVCDGRDRGDVYAPSSSSSAPGSSGARIPLATMAAALCRAVGSLALANEPLGRSSSDGIALSMLLGQSFISLSII